MRLADTTMRRKGMVALALICAFLLACLAGCAASGQTANVQSADGSAQASSQQAGSSAQESSQPSKSRYSSISDKPSETEIEEYRDFEGKAALLCAKIVERMVGSDSDGQGNS